MDKSNAVYFTETVVRWGYAMRVMTKETVFALLMGLCLGASADTVWLDEPGLWERLSSFHSHPHVTNRWTVASGDVLERCVIGCSDNALTVGLHGNAERFTARVAQKNATSPAVVVFKVWREDSLVWTSPEIASNTPPVAVDIELVGAKWIKLEMKGIVKSDQGWGIWGDAKFTMKKGSRPTDVAGLSRQLGILTPPAADPPRINAPTVFGARPGNPVRLYIPVVGKGEIDISIDGLDAPLLKELRFDKMTRLLTGVVRTCGEYPLVVRAKNSFGAAQKRLRLKIGEKIALTPPLGWNSWNAYAMDITGDKVRQTADCMVKLGLADHGWNYLTIDDGWQMRRRHLPAEKCRTPDGKIIVNEKFDDMRELADYVHARGLKFGIYSSPGVTTCCGYEGSWMHEFQDAKTYAEWGVDYLKHDWCSYGKVAFGEEPERSQYPYFLMGRALRASGRDIVFSICQYGRENVSAWGEAIGGQCWRTTNDKFDFWNDALSCIEHQADLWRYAGPGAWNDPDMMLVGKTIWSVWDHFDGTRLTPNEQYSHVSMWAMMCAPMMIGCDLSAMDDFTLSLLTNDEILELNQDELGAAAAPIDRDDAFWYWAKPMSDGSIAVAMLNLSPMEHEGKFCFVRQGMTGAWRVRDVWRQCDEGVFEKCHRASVPGHATHVIRLWPTEGAGFKDGIADIRENYWLRKVEKFRPIRPPQAANGEKGCDDCPSEKGMK